MSKSCQRKSVRTPPDHLLNSNSRSNITSCSQTHPNPQCYEGDSEDREERSYTYPVIDSVSCIPPSQQHTAQLHISKSSAMNSPHTTNRHHRGCNWGDGEKITLLVDSKRFTINPNLLTKHPNTMLGR